MKYIFDNINNYTNKQYESFFKELKEEKQKHIKRAAMLFLYDLNQKKRRWKEISFDVIEVYLHEDFQSSIHYLPQCF